MESELRDKRDEWVGAQRKEESQYFLREGRKREQKGKI